MSPDERKGLERIRRARQRFWLVVSLWGPAIWIIIRHTSQHRLIAPFTLIWALAVIYLAIAMARSRCPRCSKYFHSETDRPSWRALSTPSRCVHCGLALKPERVIYPSLE